MSDDGLLDKGHSEGSSSSGSSSGGSSRTERQTIIVSGGVYGSETFPPDTECGRCGSEAEGVLVYEKKVGGKIGEYGAPLCGTHKEDVRQDNPEWWEACEWVEFEVDE